MELTEDTYPDIALPVIAYGKDRLTLGNTDYTTSIMIGNEQPPTPWDIQALTDLSLEHLAILSARPAELILIAHTAPHQPTPDAVKTFIYGQRIGVECMQLGAACRTYNAMLSDHRDVVMGVILPSTT